MIQFLKKIFHNPIGRVKTPTILQMEAVECGAASLAMIMAHHKRFISLAELRIACGVSRDGSNAGSILEAAENYGLNAKGFKKEMEELREIPPPYIVFWEFNHFLVVEGFKGKKVYLNDPACGERIIGLEEFDKSFTGIVLTFEPTKDFKQGGERSQLIPTLARRLKGHSSTFLYLTLICIALFVPGLLIPIFTKIFIDEYIIAHTLSWIPVVLFGLIFTIILQGGLSWLKFYFLGKFQTYLSLKEAAGFLWHVLRLPIVFFNQRSSGDMLNRWEMTDSVAAMVAQDTLATFLSLLTVCLYTTLMFIFSPILTAITIIITLLNVVLLKASTRSLVGLNQSISNEYGKWHGTATNGIQMIETIKSSGLEKDLFSNWIGQFTKIINLQQNLTKISNGLSVLFLSLPQLNIILILTVGGYFVLHGKLTLGTLIAFQVLSKNLMEPLAHLTEVLTKIQSMHIEMNRLDDVLRYQLDETLEDKNNSETLITEFHGNITFCNVSFGYDVSHEPIIRNLNITLEKGKWIGIVGASCSGRSTIARLAVGLYKPWSGEILYDGKPRSHFSPEVLATALSFVSQEIILFEGTIRQNLNMWNRTISDESIINAAKDAQAHDVIAVRQEGYDCHVQEGGSNFSGGEKQRIEIARALATNPTALILDEATSALDSMTEQKLIKNIKKRNCSCLMISHRLSAIKECDEILVFHHGEIIQQGTYQKLLEEKDGLFLRLLSHE